MKKITKIFIFAVLSAAFLIILGLKIYPTIVEFFPLPSYKPTDQKVENESLCTKIKDNRFQELCFGISKKDFTESLSLVSKETGYLQEYYPWYNYPYYLTYPPERVEKIFTEGANNSAQWCKEVFPHRSENGSIVKEDYYFCQAVLENPYFCSKISYQIGESGDICYQDAAFVWNDSSFCQKAKYPDFCYLRLVLKSRGI